MKFEQNEERSLRELALALGSAVGRYWRVSLGPAVVFFWLVAIVSWRLPDYYTSDVLILRQPQRVASNIVKAPSKNAVKERMQSLVQVVLSRPRLRSIIERFNLYPDLRGPKGIELAIKQLRSAIKVKVERSPTGMQGVQNFSPNFSP